MKNLFLLTILLPLTALTPVSCDKKADAGLGCNNITLNTPFLARIGEEWCLPTADWSIKFGPFVEDSRCNVIGVECVWAGRYVMGASLRNGSETVQDTFNAVYNWTDTLYSGPYSIILSKIYPETRTSTDPVDPSKYSFDVTVR